MHLYIFYYFIIFITLTKSDDENIEFNPTSISFAIDDQQSVEVHLNENITSSVFVTFLYDDKEENVLGHIDTIPNITFNNSYETQTINIIARREGHLVVAAITTTNISLESKKSFILIDIARSNVLNIFIQIVGWIYFVAWSISFYPQIILNFRRRSVVGLNFDFLALNVLGHSCYSVFNLSLYISTNIQEQYFIRHPHGVLPVLLNDVIFSCHAVFASTVTVIQCIFFERKNQRVSYIATAIACILIVFLLISSIVSLAGPLSTLDLLYYFSYVKLAITIIKYCPQAWMNYRRKSTEGWSIGNILLDFTGGLLSLIQMFLLAKNYDDWSSIFGSPTKLGLGLFSIFFDLIFIVQHYILYRNHIDDERLLNSEKEIDERSPMLYEKS